MTTQTAMEPTRMERQARLMKAVNVPMRKVLALPFRTPLSDRLMLVSHTGRRTGRHYRQPVSYVLDGDTLLTPGGGRWTRNLRDGEPAEIRLRGRKVRARPDLVRDVDEAEALLHRMVERNPRLATFVPFIGKDGSIDRGTLANAIAHGFCVVRWHVEEAAR